MASYLFAPIFRALLNGDGESRPPETPNETLPQSQSPGHGPRNAQAEERGAVPLRAGLGVQGLSAFHGAHHVGLTGATFYNAHGDVIIHNYPNTTQESRADPADRAPTASGQVGHSNNHQGDDIPYVELSQAAQAPQNNARIVPPAFQVQRTCDIYYRQLAIKGRGSPLWIPEPNNNLSMEYRRIGVAIGDVGIITELGSFDFLFNICLPANHPINRGGLPEGFSQFEYMRPDDIRWHTEFKTGSYLASTSVKKSHYEDDFLNNGLIFESSAGEGAILTMPNGADSTQLASLLHFEDYMAEHLENWYRFIIGIRGRKVRNGDVRLVIGCDTTSEWGMAAFSNSSQSGSFQLKFRPMADRSSGRMYGWESSGMAEVKTGPNSAEVNELNIDRNENMQSSYPNQCLFLRTLNPTLEEETWVKLTSVIKSSRFNVRDNRLSYSSRSSVDSSGLLPGDATSGGSDRASGSSGVTPRPPIVRSFHVANEATTLTVHPSNAINELILQRVKDTFDHPRMIITSDLDWISVLTKDDITLPSADELLLRIMKANTLQMKNDNNVLSLKPASTELEKPATDIDDSLEAQRELARQMDGEKADASSTPSIASSGSNLSNRAVGSSENFSRQHDGIRISHSPNSGQFSQSSNYNAPGPAFSPKPHLFALIIGIDVYKSTSIPSLRGSEADALSFKEYLEFYLKVPPAQITVLLNKDATRSNIIKAFKQLEQDPRIQEGDPIVIFYSGMGGEGRSGRGGGPENDTQLLIPYDFSSVPGLEVLGIPDRTICALTDRIAKAKGDNITVIFDCCHSASSMHSGSRSHVLIAACGSHELAFESYGHSNFSAALLKLLRTISPDKLRYCDLLTRMEALPRQNPQCQGQNVHRFLFDTKIKPMYLDYSYPIRLDTTHNWPSGQFILGAGSAHGITEGAEFTVFLESGAAFLQQTATVTAVSVMTFISFLQSPPGFNLNQTGFAIQTKAGRKEDFRLYVPPKDPFRDLFKLACSSRYHSKYCLDNITLVDNPGDAHLGASRKDNKVVFDMMDMRATLHGFKHQFGTDADVDSVASLLGRAGHFYRTLNRGKTGTGRPKFIDIQFYKLQESDSEFDELGDPVLEPVGPNLCQNGNIDFMVDQGASYGVKIVNSSSHNLYAYLFYFDNSNFSISPYYQNPATSGGYKADYTLSPGTLTIGYGSGGVAPFSFKLGSNQDVNVGFLKLFVSSRAIDLSHIPERASPLSFTFPPSQDMDVGLLKLWISTNVIDPPLTPRYSGAPRWRRPEMWDSVLIPIIQRYPGDVRQE